MKHIKLNQTREAKMKRIIFIAALIAMFAIAAYADDEIIIRKYPGGPIVVAASNAPAQWIKAANYKCDGTADNIEIQAAIDLAAETGNEVHLSPGLFTIATSIATKSGVWIRGIYPIVGTSGVADLTISISGGTILTGQGVTIFTANAVYGGGVENLAFDDVGTAISGGTTNIFGPQFWTLRNIIIKNFDETGLYLSNFGECTIDQVSIFKFDHTTETTIVGAHFLSDNDSSGCNFQPGNSVIRHLFVNITKSESTARNIKGIYVQAKNPYYDSAYHQGMSLNYLTFIKPQSVQFSFSGTKAGSNRTAMYIAGELAGGFTTVVNANVIDGYDGEGDVEYHLYIAYTYKTFVRVAGFSSTDDAVYNTYLDTGCNDVYVHTVADSSWYNTLTSRGDVRVITDYGGFGSIPRENSATLSAATLTSTYGINSIILSRYNGAPVYTLPACKKIYAGQGYIIKKILYDGAITLNSQVFVAAQTDKTYTQSTKRIAGTFTNCVSSECVGMVAVVTAGTGETHITPGTYEITVSSDTYVELRNDISDDAGASAPYLVNVTVYESILNDGVYNNTYSEVDTRGDWAQIMCDGWAGWHVLGKYIAP